MRTIVWFRGKDLRISDHAPLRAACASGEVIPLFVLDPYFFAPERARALPHRMQFLLDSIAALAANLEQRGSRLLLVAGKSTEIVPKLCDVWRADRVVAQRWVEPFARERDRRIGAALGTRFELFEGETLLPPTTLRTRAGTPYAVFSQFARAFHDVLVPIATMAAPRRLPALPTDIEAARDATGGKPSIPDCAALGIVRNRAVLLGGEAEGRARLKSFLQQHLVEYAVARDELARPGTSRLSADLKFGTLSVRHVWNSAMAASAGADREKFLSELVWREFAHSTLWDRPELLHEPFRAAFAGFPWRDAAGEWDAWCSGNTGYPIVDAAARQLLAEGFVHNRARMVAASFVSKHLLIDYRRGEAHYMKYLTDGDWANNNLGWQWSAGCGCDAQPYFRIFNPVTQGEKFDPTGSYVRRWLPELAALPDQYIQRPWEAPVHVLTAASVALGRNYPFPIVEHKSARQRFLSVADAHLKRRPAA